MKKSWIILLIVLVVIAATASAVFLLTNQQAHNDKPAPVASPSIQKKSPPPLSYVDQAIAKLSLRDKVASLFIFHVPGGDPKIIAAYYSEHRPSGLIFMSDNIPYTLDELRAETAALITDKQLPPFIATDEEGDTVKRLGADTYPGALTLRNSPPEVTKDAFTQRSNLLKSVGINLNFGIIADVTADPHSFIYNRVLGTTPAASSARVTQAVLGSKGITLSTLKHFPGHGETEADSHISVPTTNITYDEWLQRDAPSFQAGVSAGADMVMFGHLRYSSVDSQPASLSAKWHDIIRSKMGFKSVVITDDMGQLQDSGEAAYIDPVKNAVAAVQAGNDLLLYVLNHGNAPTDQVDPEALINGIVTGVNNGQISQSIIDQHVRRVYDLRHSLATTFYK